MKRQVLPIFTTVLLAVAQVLIAPGIAKAFSGQKTVDSHNSGGVIQEYASFGGGSGVDSVDLLRGGVVINIPLFSLPGRGQSVSYSITYRAHDLFGLLDFTNPSERLTEIVNPMNQRGTDERARELYELTCNPQDVGFAYVGKGRYIARCMGTPSTSFLPPQREGSPPSNILDAEGGATAMSETLSARYGVYAYCRNNPTDARSNCPAILRGAQGWLSAVKNWEENQLSWSVGNWRIDPRAHLIWNQYYRLWGSPLGPFSSPNVPYQELERRVRENAGYQWDYRDYLLDRFILVLPDGSKHEFAVDHTESWIRCAVRREDQRLPPTTTRPAGAPPIRFIDYNCPNYANSKRVYRSLDGSNLVLDMTDTSRPTVIGSDGSKMVFTTLSDLNLEPVFASLVESTTRQSVNVADLVSVIDADGNMIRYEFPDSMRDEKKFTSNGFIGKIVDTLGREISWRNEYAPKLNYRYNLTTRKFEWVTEPMLNKTVMRLPNGSEYKIYYDNLFFNHTALYPDIPFNTLPYGKYTDFLFTTVSKIEAPNGRSYTFGYEHWWNNALQNVREHGYVVGNGHVTSIVYPTGGTVKYEYSGPYSRPSNSIIAQTDASFRAYAVMSGFCYVPGNVFANNDELYVASNCASNPYEVFLDRRVKARHVQESPFTSPSTWRYEASLENFSPNSPSPRSRFVQTVTNPDQSKVIHRYFAALSVQPNFVLPLYAHPLFGREMETVIIGSDGAQLRKTVTIYEPGEPFSMAHHDPAVANPPLLPPEYVPRANTRVVETVSVLSDITPVKVSKSTLVYDRNGRTTQVDGVTYRHTFGNVIETKSYDYGEGQPGALLRISRRSYLTDPRYLDQKVNMVNIVTCEEVIDPQRKSGKSVGASETCTGTDPGGTLVSQTRYAIDTIPPQAPSGGGATAALTTLTHGGSSASFLRRVPWSAPVAALSAIGALLALFALEVARRRLKARWWFDLVAPQIRKAYRLVIDILLSAMSGHRKSTGLSMSPSPAPVFGTIAVAVMALVFALSVSAAVSRTSVSGVPGYNASYVSLTTRGNVTETSVMNYNPVTQTTKWLSASAAFDIFGNLVSARDTGEGATPFAGKGSCRTTTQYTHPYAYPVSITNCLGHRVRQTWDAKTGWLLSSTDVNGQITRYTYDTIGRVTRTQYPDGGATSVTYVDTPGNVSVTETRSGPAAPTLTTVTSYNGLGLVREVRSQSRSGDVIVKTEYDQKFRPFRQSLPYFASEQPRWTTTTYDDLDRPLTVTEPDGSTSRTSYKGNETYTYDAQGREKLVVVDALGRVIRSSDPNPTTGRVDGGAYVTTSVYDVNGKALSITNGDQTRTFTYDTAGNVLRECHPEYAGKCMQYVYDSRGNVIRATDPRGVTIVSVYDNLNRVTRVSFEGDRTGTPAETYTYDAAVSGSVSPTGKLSVVSVGPLTKEFAYDSMGRIVRETMGVTLSEDGEKRTFTAHYAYDGIGNLTRLTYPSGRVLSYTYDDLGRVTSVADASPGMQNVQYAQISQFNAASQPLSMRLGSAISGTFEYNELNQLTRRAFTGQGPLMDLSYSYPVRGQNIGLIMGIADRVRPEESQTYQYDALNRLIAANASQWSQIYTYDRYGNLLRQEGRGQAPTRETPASNATNRLLSVNGVPIRYDAAGNQLNVAIPNVPASDLTWDAKGRLVRAIARGADGNVVSQTYYYDEGGWRFATVTKDSAGTRISYTIRNLSGMNILSTYEKFTKGTAGAPIGPVKKGAGFQIE